MPPASFTKPPTVVIDACSLYPRDERDLLIELALAGAFNLRWSNTILGELACARYRLNRDACGISKRPKIEKMLALMTETLMNERAGCLVEDSEIFPLINSMPNDKKDRHVLAAAVASKADVVVTDNIKDFPKAVCDPLGVRRLRPDDYLEALAQSLSRDPFDKALQALANRWVRPKPWSLEQVVGRYCAVYPKFGKVLQAELQYGVAPSL